MDLGHRGEVRVTLPGWWRPYVSLLETFLNQLHQGLTELPGLDWQSLQAKVPWVQWGS